VLAGLDRRDGVAYPVLVPNERGLDRALAAGVRHVAIFASATETFAAKNLNSTLDDQFAMFTPTIQRALAEGLTVRGYVSMCYGDPWEGDVPIDQVVKVGARVREFKLGDEVYARPDDFRIGTFAEFVAVKEASLALKPKGLTMEEAASIPLVGLTAWQALVEKANLKKGQKVFIQAGSGGVGTFAIQLAKHLGATVATTTSTGNVELVKSLGADVVIDYKTQDFEDVLRDYDVVLNSQDGKTLEKSLRVLKGGGKLVSISGPPDPEFGKEIAAPGFVKLVMWLLSWGIRRKAKSRGVSFSFLFMKANGTQLREIARLFDAGVIRPVVDRVFPFESTNEAMAYVEAGRAKGKVVVKIK